MMVYVDTARCTGCGRCVGVCPAGAISLVDGRAQISQSLCTGCETCLSVCPETAILSVSEAGEPASRAVATPAKRTAMAPALQQRTTLAVVSGAVVAVGRMVLPRLLDWVTLCLQRDAGKADSRSELTPHDRSDMGRGGGRRRRRRGSG